MSAPRTAARFPIFQALYLSFYSRPFYRDVARVGQGLLVSYVLFLVALSWLPQTANLHREFREFLDAEAPKFLKQVPKITIARGRASIDEPVPYFIYKEDGMTPLAIIDTSGSIASLEKSPALLLLTETVLMVRRSGTDVRELPLADLGDAVIDRQTISSWLEAFSGVFAVVLYPFAVLFGFLLHLLLVLAGALFGGMIAKRLGLDLDFRAIFRLAVVSFTPALLLVTAHAVLDIPFPYSLPVTFVVSLGYLSYALAANTEKTGAGGKD